MNQKLTKSQIKRQKLREETELINLRRKKINECELINDLLEPIPIFKNFNRNGLNLTIKSFYHSPKELEDWIFNLVKTTMKPFYDNGNGWSDNVKRNELF